ncbi:MAG: hypothetical protein E6344_02695 [Clostridium sp.]|uniref:hypothetical protein n=1 Tax=Clostridium culturomicium TaxID=1499683 RepID=UPI00058F5482|nr:hypothetical protein [Clostridium culturomicium]MDU4892181.1 hypothetical protein [Clostridium sp.]MDU7082568.1 hypothetical protein [Clostridium sp.]
MKKNTSFLVITLILAVVVSAPLIGNLREGISKDSDEGNVSAPAASVITDEVINMKGSKYGEYTYNKYENPRYGFSIDYPSFLTEAKESQNGDGIILQNKENTIVVILSGVNNALHKTSKELYEGYLNNTRGVVYKKRIGNSFMIAAENGNNSYFIYEVAGEGSINTFIVGYPKEDSKEFDKIIKEMKKSFETPYVHKAR